MGKTVGYALGLAAALFLALPASSVGAAALLPAPTNVTVAWEGVGAGRAVRVSWQETGAQPNRVCQDGILSSRCVDTTAAQPDSVLMQVDQFLTSASTRVGVQVLGTPASEFAYSAVFDTQRLAPPTVTHVVPWVDGRLMLSWTPAAAPADTTPNDPLDLPPPSPAQYRTAFSHVEFYDFGPLLDAPTTVISAPRGVLVWVVAVNEWGFTSPPPFAPEASAGASVWETLVRATIPASATYGQTTVVTGAVTADPWVCTSMPPSCSQPIPGGPGTFMTPSAGRQVVLQGRTSSATAWYTVTSTVSGAQGNFRFTVRAPGTREYRVLVLGVSKPPTSDAKSAAVTARVRTVTRNRVLSARFDDPYVRFGDHVTARLTTAVRSQVRTTLQRWNGSAWVNVKWVYLTQGTGSYTFTATTRGVVGWRFVIPASISPAGLPVAGISSGPFYYKAI